MGFAFARCALVTTPRNSGVSVSINPAHGIAQVTKFAGENELWNQCTAETSLHVLAKCFRAALLSAGVCIVRPAKAALQGHYTRLASKANAVRTCVPERDTVAPGDSPLIARCNAKRLCVLDEGTVGRKNIVSSVAAFRHFGKRAPSL